MPWIIRKESEKISLSQIDKENYKGKSPPKALSHTLLSGSLTVEAACVLPIFLFAAIMVLYLFRVVQVQYIVGNSLDKAAAEVSLMGRVSEKEAKNLTKAAFYKELAEQGCPLSGIEFGLAGFSLKNTTADLLYIDAAVTYRVMFPLRFFGKKGIKLTDGCRMHRWVGDQEEGADKEKGAEWVYVTPTQHVYHLSRGCTHLKLSIRAVPNSSPAWKVYKPCGHCIKDGKTGRTVYITNEGGHYHGKIDCSGLKRTIFMVPKEQAGDKKPCSRCGGK